MKLGTRRSPGPVGRTEAPRVVVGCWVAGSPEVQRPASFYPPAPATNTPGALLRRVRRVVATDLVAILVLVASRPVAVGVVVGRVLDLVLRQADVDLLLGRVDSLDDAGRDEALLAEDPEPVSTTT